MFSGPPADQRRDKLCARRDYAHVCFVTVVEDLKSSPFEWVEIAKVETETCVVYSFNLEVLMRVTEPGNRKTARLCGQPNCHRLRRGYIRGTDRVGSAVPTDSAESPQGGYVAAPKGDTDVRMVLRLDQNLLGREGQTLNST
jgi:hypothetical protein